MEIKKYKDKMIKEYERFNKDAFIKTPMPSDELLLAMFFSQAIIWEMEREYIDEQGQ